MSAGEILLILVGVLVATVGFVRLSSETVGLGLLCAACFFAILARIAQAGAQHKQLLTFVKKRNSA